MVVLEPEHSDIDFFMILVKMDNIQLNKVQDEKPLPKGVYCILVNNIPVFVRRQGIHFMPLSDKEQKELREKYLK